MPINHGSVSKKFHQCKMTGSSKEEPREASVPPLQTEMRVFTHINRNACVLETHEKTHTHCQIKERLSKELTF